MQGEKSNGPEDPFQEEKKKDTDSERIQVFCTVEIPPHNGRKTMGKSGGGRLPPWHVTVVKRGDGIMGFLRGKNGRIDKYQRQKNKKNNIHGLVRSVIAENRLQNAGICLICG